MGCQQSLAQVGQPGAGGLRFVDAATGVLHPQRDSPPSTLRCAPTSMRPPASLGSMPWRTAFSTSVSSVIGGRRRPRNAGSIVILKSSRSGMRICISSRYERSSATSWSSVAIGAASAAAARRSTECRGRAAPGRGLGWPHAPARCSLAARACVRVSAPSARCARDSALKPPRRWAALMRASSSRACSRHRLLASARAAPLGRSRVVARRFR